MSTEFYTSVNRYGNSLLYRGYDLEGKKMDQRVKYKPRIFVPDSTGKGEWKTMEGNPVRPMDFETMKDFREFTLNYKDVSNFSYYGMENHITSFIQRKFPNKIDYDRRLINVVNFDIETAIGEGFPTPEKAAEEIRAITAHSTRHDQYDIWLLGQEGDYRPRRDEVVYFHRTEAELLQSFIDWWSDSYYSPDIITGWNTRFFDIPYLVNRTTRILGEKEAKKFSPWKIVNEREIHHKQTNSKDITYDLLGIQHLDYIELFKKFAYTYGNQESYSLNHISHVVLGEEKLDYSEIGTLNDLYEQDRQKFIEYNRKDVELVNRIDDQLGLIDIVLTIAYMAGVNYEDALKTTPVWDSIIYRRLCKAKTVVPAKQDNPSKVEFEGGFVKEPKPGMYDWVMSFDLNSLYPNIIVQWNMSPETLLPEKHTGVKIDDIIEGKPIADSDPNTAIAANGAQFSTEKQGVIPILVSEIYDARKANKKKMIQEKKRKEELLQELSNL
jgi:DNA polymerase elongation subunit (family B)